MLCNLVVPARAQQSLNSIQGISQVAGGLCRVYTHTLRLEAARDMAHLPVAIDGRTNGYTTTAVAEGLGRSRNSMAKGLTGHYIGGNTDKTYNRRAENQCVNPWQSSFAEDSWKGNTGFPGRRSNRRQGDSLDKLQTKTGVSRSAASKALLKANNKELGKSAKRGALTNWSNAEIDEASAITRFIRDKNEKRMRRNGKAYRSTNTVTQLPLNY